MQNPQNMIMDFVRLNMMSGLTNSFGKNSNIGALLTIFLMILYENLSKYSPFIIGWGVETYKNRNKPKVITAKNIIKNILPETPKSQIICQKSYDSKATQALANRVDAIIMHICSLPSSTSLNYNGVDFIPAFNERVQIDSDIYFKLITLEEYENTVKYIKFELSSYNNDVHHIQRFIDTCYQNMERKIKNKLGNHMYFFDQISEKTKGGFQASLPPDFLVFRKNVFTTSRTFNNVFFEERELVENRVEFFKERRDWYDEKGIPYTLGMLFSGPPGCGKTSTIKAIANETKRHVINVHLSDIKTNTQLKNLFYNDELIVYDSVINKAESLFIPIAERMYVIEDIDAMKSIVLKRSGDSKDEAPVQSYSAFAGGGTGDMVTDMKMKTGPKEVTDPVDLSTLLNILDGTLEIPGRIICISSNYPERLDEALIRPGRIDMVIQFKKCNKEIMVQMFNSFYSELGEVFTEEDFNADYKFSPAEVNQILFQNFHEPRKAKKIINEGNPSDIFKYSHSS